MKWNFPASNHGHFYGINDSGISNFKGIPVEGLTREICQNSLDAIIEFSESPVRIEFHLFNMPAKNFPERGAFIEILNSCKSSWKGLKDKKTVNFCDNALKTLCSDYISVLRISDFNTKGLCGAANINNASDWRNLVHSSGVSNKGASDGGSHGVGKSAPFACSFLQTVFYSTAALDGTEAYQGVANIVSHNIPKSDDHTQPIGYYGNDKNSPIFQQFSIDNNFTRSKTDYGTDIYIMGYKQTTENSWQDEIVLTILNNFLYAVWSNQLVVEIGDITVNKDTLEDIMQRYDKVLSRKTGTLRCVKSFYAALKNPTRVFIDDFEGLGKISLYLYVNEKILYNRVAVVRKNGMKIFEKDHLPKLFKYSGILYIEGDEVNAKFRAMENASHDKWDPARVDEDPKSLLVKQAEKLQKSLFELVVKHINELSPYKDTTAIDAFGAGQYLPIAGSDEEYNNGIDLENSFSVDIAETFIMKPPFSTIEINENISNEFKETDDSNAEETMAEDGSKAIDGNGDGGGLDGNSQTSTGTGTDLRRGNGPNGGENTPDGNTISHQKPAMLLTAKAQFVPVNVKWGEFTLFITPPKDINPATIKLRIKGESGDYPVDIKSAQMNDINLSINKNIINNFSLVKDHANKISITIDYYDYCSLEAMLYEN